jgi:hypothetical protein
MIGHKHAQAARFAIALRSAPELSGRVHDRAKDTLVDLATRWAGGLAGPVTLSEAVQPQIRWSVLALDGAREAVARALIESTKAGER